MEGSQIAQVGLGEKAHNYLMSGPPLCSGGMGELSGPLGPQYRQCEGTGRACPSGHPSPGGSGEKPSHTSSSQLPPCIFALRV